ncbi:galactokinase [Kamptonema cortianum]|nr:galactokinase [Geitlerinema splendidum]MDK3155229.1 galactokinase [Kamptonema cortianum]
MKALAAEFFESAYGYSAEWYAFAPGRINLIGEHTDYSEGFVFPMAIQHGITIAAGLNGTHKLRLISNVAGEAENIDLLQLRTSWIRPRDWGVYPAAVARELRFEIGLDVAIVSDLPMAGGVSSSAALEIAFATLFNSFGGDLTPLELARLAQHAESELVGVPCGIMDMLASACGVEGSALLVDTRDLSIEPVAIPSKYEIYLADTGKSRELAKSDYGKRAKQCADAARLLGCRVLRDVRTEDLANLSDEVLLRRARHVLSENDRVVSFQEALLKGDDSQIGYLLAESHQSLRDDFEVSCDELDVMVDSCLSVPGCIGARMTGAGFGGACVAIFRAGGLQIGPMIEQIYSSGVKTYKSRVRQCLPSGGARII